MPTESSMQAYVVAPPFGIGALARVRRPTPRAGPGQVLVRMRAVALNYRDLLIVRGVWRAPGPRVPASDGVGEVVAVGDGVTRVALGDRVAGTFFPRWLGGDLRAEDAAGAPGGTAADGVLAEYVAFDAEAVVRVPGHLSDAEAATLPCAAVTAWHAVVVRGRVGPADTVLVQGTGGVSLFALQFARLAGARVLVTSGSDAKLERARSLGADAGVNYRARPAWDEAALELTGGAGADHVVDVVGGANLNRSLGAVRTSGTVSVVGLLAGERAEVDTFRIATKNVRLHGIEVGSRAMFEAMNAEVGRAGLRPVVDRVFAFDEAPDALAYLASGAHVGKVVVRL